MSTVNNSSVTPAADMNNYDLGKQELYEIYSQDTKRKKLENDITRFLKSYNKLTPNDSQDKYQKTVKNFTTKKFDQANITQYLNAKINTNIDFPEAGNKLIKLFDKILLNKWNPYKSEDSSLTESEEDSSTESVELPQITTHDVTEQLHLPISPVISSEDPVIQTDQNTPGFILEHPLINESNSSSEEIPAAEETSPTLSSAFSEDINDTAATATPVPVQTTPQNITETPEQRSDEITSKENSDSKTPSASDNKPVSPKKSDETSVKKWLPTRILMGIGRGIKNFISAVLDIIGAPFRWIKNIFIKN